jgi:hypothetical protein
MTVGMQREKSASASAMRMSDVAFGFLWQAIFTSDNINLLSAIGAVMVMAGVMVIVIYKQVEVKKEVVEIEIVGVDNTSNESRESNTNNTIYNNIASVKGNSVFGRIILEPITKASQSNFSKLVTARLRKFQEYRRGNIQNSPSVKYTQIAQSENDNLNLL